MAHRLELAINDALQGTLFKKVDQMLTKLYAIHHKSLKKPEELKSLHEQSKSTFDFLEGSLKMEHAGFHSNWELSE